MKELNKRQEAILRKLERGPANAWALEDDLYFGVEGYNTTPIASIRRAIQALRRRGYNISFADPVTGVYTLTPTLAHGGPGDPDLDSLQGAQFEEDHLGVIRDGDPS